MITHSIDSHCSKLRLPSLLSHCFLNTSVPFFFPFSKCSLVFMVFCISKRIDNRSIHFFLMFQKTSSICSVGSLLCVNPKHDSFQTYITVHHTSEHREASFTFVSPSRLSATSTMLTHFPVQPGVWDCFQRANVRYPLALLPKKFTQC